MMYSEDHPCFECDDQNSTACQDCPANVEDCPCDYCTHEDAPCNVAPCATCGTAVANFNPRPNL